MKVPFSDNLVCTRSANKHSAINSDCSMCLAKKYSDKIAECAWYYLDLKIIDIRKFQDFQKISLPTVARGFCFLFLRALF